MPGTSDRPRDALDAKTDDELLAILQADQDGGPRVLVARVLAVLVVALAFGLMLVAL